MWDGRDGVEQGWAGSCRVEEKGWGECKAGSGGTGQGGAGQGSVQSWLWTPQDYYSCTSHSHTPST